MADQPFPQRQRIVCQFSCGAASAIATRLAIWQYAATHEVVVVNAFIVEEDQDNRRFAADCAQWFGRPIVELRDEKFGASTHEVFRRERFMNGPHGAPCSRALKRRVLDAFALPADVMVFGYTIEEVDRLADYRDHHPGRSVVAPLIERGLSKADCKAMIERAGIELPRMYRLGYQNANCIGCVKGGMGYWRAIREDFPAEFAALSEIQQGIGPGANFLQFRSGPRKGERMSLADLPDGPIQRNKELPACSFFCEAAERELETCNG